MSLLDHLQKKGVIDYNPDAVLQLTEKDLLNLAGSLVVGNFICNPPSMDYADAFYDAMMEDNGCAIIEDHLDIVSQEMVDAGYRFPDDENGFIVHESHEFESPEAIQKEIVSDINSMFSMIKRNATHVNAGPAIESEGASFQLTYVSEFDSGEVIGTECLVSSASGNVHEIKQAGFEPEGAMIDHFISDEEGNRYEIDTDKYENDNEIYLTGEALLQVVERMRTEPAEDEDSSMGM